MPRPVANSHEEIRVFIFGDLWKQPISDRKLVEPIGIEPMT